MNDEHHAGPGLTKKSAQRFPGLDVVRGLAVLLMIIYHFAFDLDYFGLYPMAVTDGLWRIFARSIAISFLLIVGISMAITRARYPSRAYTHYLARGMTIAAYGAGITFVTWLVVPKEFIFFGVLHLIGLSVMIAPFFFRLGSWNMLVGIPAVAIGFYLNNATIITSPLLAWLGVPYYGMTTLDWFPVFPWFGVVLFGMGAGTLLYPNGVPLWNLSWNLSLTEKRSIVMYPLRLLGRFGRQSLVVYLLHQPLLIFLLLLTTGKLTAFL